MYRPSLTDLNLLSFIPTEQEIQAINLSSENIELFGKVEIIDNKHIKFTDMYIRGTYFNIKSKSPIEDIHLISYNDHQDSIINMKFINKNISLISIDSKGNIIEFKIDAKSTFRKFSFLNTEEDILHSDISHDGKYYISLTNDSLVECEITDQVLKRKDYCSFNNILDEYKIYDFKFFNKSNKILLVTSNYYFIYDFATKKSEKIKFNKLFKKTFLSNSNLKIEEIAKNDSYFILQDHKCCYLVNLLTDKNIIRTLSSTNLQSTHFSSEEDLILIYSNQIITYNIKNDKENTKEFYSNKDISSCHCLVKNYLINTYRMEADNVIDRNEGFYLRVTNIDTRNSAIINQNYHEAKIKRIIAADNNRGE